MNCELEVNICIPDPCENNATCVNLFTNYTCLCPTGYTGNNCKFSFSSTVSSSIVPTTTIPIPTRSVPVNKLIIAASTVTTVIIVLLIVTGLVCIITIYCKYRTSSTAAEQEHIPVILRDMLLADNEAYCVQSHIPLINTEAHHINIQETDIPVTDNEAYDMRIAATNINYDLLYDEIMT